MYFALCAAVLLLAAAAAVAYVSVQSDRDSRHVAESDARYAASTAARQLGMSGLDLIEQLRATRPHVKVVLLSGYSAEVLTDLALPAETVFLQKPFDDATLLQRLRSLLDDEPQLRPQGRRQGSDSAR